MKLGVIADFDRYPEWADSITSATVLTHDDEGRPEQVKFSLDAGPIKDTYVLAYDWQPDGVIETVGSTLGFDDRRVKGDLERFKSFIEERGAATGAWRGSVEQNDVTGTRQGS